MPTKKEKLDKKTVSNIQKQVCADILRTSDVLKSQVMSSLVEELGTKLDRNEFTSIKGKLENQIASQMSSLVERVIKNTTV